MDRSPDQMKPAGLPVAEKPAECPTHGPYTSRCIMRSIWSRCPECSSDDAEAEGIEARRRAEHEAEAAHLAAVESARIPARFVGRNFENFIATTSPQRHALTVARDFAESFPGHARRGSGLIFAGMPGTGKSHIAAAVLQTVLSRDVRYLTCMDLIRVVRDTWRRDSERSETQVLAYLEKLDLLVIDEVGAQYGTEGEQTILFDVLDRRYREVKPTILITNQDREGFGKFIGERTFDRLKETCRWVPFDWPSHRPTVRRESA